MPAAWECWKGWIAGKAWNKPFAFQPVFLDPSLSWRGFKRAIVPMTSSGWRMLKRSVARGKLSPRHAPFVRLYPLICASTMPPIMATQPSASRRLSISPRITHPASTANTLSSDMISEATVGSVSFCATICSV